MDYIANCKTVNWIPVDVFHKFERDWNKICPEGLKGYMKKEAIHGSSISGIRLDERILEAMDRGGGNTGYVSLQDLMREVFCSVSRWDIKRYFVSEIPDEQLLTLKGSFGQSTTMRYLARDSKYFNLSFDSLTQNSVDMLSLRQLLSANECLGNMKLTVDQFVESAYRCQMEPQHYRATFWELLVVLFPNVSLSIIERYKADFVPSSDVLAFVDCFRGKHFINVHELKQILKSSNMKTLQMSNGIILDPKSFGSLDRDKDGKLSLYELIQSYFPNVPPPMVKRAIQRHNSITRKEQTTDKERDKKNRLRLPVLTFLKNEQIRTERKFLENSFETAAAEASKEANDDNSSTSTTESDVCIALLSCRSWMR